MPVRFLPRLLVVLSAASLAMSMAGCAALNQWFAPPPPPPPAPAKPPRPSYDLVASIRAAGANEKSVIDVHPLSDPGVTALQDAAHADEQAGRYPDAAAKLDQALKLNPDSPDLLQDRAEIAVRMRDYPLAERLAHRSWDIGPKFGPLCARNWQTIVEMRLQADDQAGANTARNWVKQCHKAGVNRF